MSARICQKSQSKGKSCFDRVALLLKKILCKSVSFSSFALWVCPKASSVYRNRLVNDNISKNCILYIWGYLGYVLKFQTHIDMLTCLLFRKCLGGRPNLEEIFCQSQHPSDINPGLTNPLLIRMISTVISMGFQVISCYIGVSFSMFVQLVSWKWSTGSRSRHPSSALARASVNQGVLVCIQCAGTSASEATIMKPMRLEYSKTFQPSNSKWSDRGETSLSI